MPYCTPYSIPDTPDFCLRWYHLHFTRYHMACQFVDLQSQRGARYGHLGVRSCVRGLCTPIVGLEVVNWWIQFSHSSDRVTWSLEKLRLKDLSQVYGALTHYSVVESLISQLWKKGMQGKQPHLGLTECSRLDTRGPRGMRGPHGKNPVQANYQSDLLLPPWVHKCSTAASLYP